MTDKEEREREKKKNIGNSVVIDSGELPIGVYFAILCGLGGRSKNK